MGNEAPAAAAVAVDDVCAKSLDVASPFVQHAVKVGNFSVVLPRSPAPEQGSAVPDVVADDSVQILVGDTYYIAHGQSLDAVIPADKLESAYDMVRDGAAAEVEGTITRDRSVRCGGHVGREFIVLAKDRVAANRLRFFFVGNHGYLVSYTAPAGREDAPQGEAFLDSLRITP